MEKIGKLFMYTYKSHHTHLALVLVSYLNSFYYKFVFSAFGEVEEDNKMPKDLAEKRVNQKSSQTEELPSSTLYTRTQELIGESGTEASHLRAAEGHHDELDRMCEAQRPEFQAVEKEEKQNGRSSGAESEEALHGEGGR